MVETIQPQSVLPIARLLKDPFDTATYYVQAVIRNARLNTTIAIVNLITQGNRIYAANWQTPADSSGQGFFITITTSVYTDSGYTTKSDNYGEEQDIFLIYDRQHYVQSLGQQISALISGVQGSEIDYAKVRKIIKEEISKIEPAEEKEMNLDLSPVLSALSNLGSVAKSVLECVERIENEEEDEEAPLDLSGIHESIESASEAIKSHIDASKPKDAEPIDFAPITSAIEALDSTSAIKEVGELMKNIPDIKKSMSDIRSSIQEFLYAISSKAPEPAESKPKASLNKAGNLIIRT